MTKILITGSSGQLGSELKKISAQFPELDFTFTDVEELDITSANAVSDFLDALKPQYLVNCAAYTAVDKAETDISKTTLINKTAVGFLSEASAKVGCRIIHVSTDYVFDGRGPRPYTEENPTAPQSVYGATKLEGELLCMANNPDCIIIRTSWLYSAFGNNFVKTMLRLGNERPEIGVIVDQIGTPTNAADLARAILSIISSVEKGEKEYMPGIYHYSNEGVASWFDFTKAIFEFKNIDCKVKPIGSEEYPSPVQRPAYSVLNKSKIKKVYGLTIPYWRDSLRDYFQINN